MSKFLPGYQPAGNTNIKGREIKRPELDKESAKEKWRSVMKRIYYFQDNPEKLKLADHERLIDELYSEKRELDSVINPTWK